MSEIRNTNTINTVETIQYKCDKCNTGHMLVSMEKSVLKKLHVCSYCKDTKSLNNKYPIVRNIK